MANNGDLITYAGLSAFKTKVTNLLSGKQFSLTTSTVTDGTLTKVIGFDANGNLKKGDAPSSGGGANVNVVSTLPTTGEEDGIYLADTNASSQGGIVEIPVPTSSDEGKLFEVDSSGDVILGHNVNDIIEVAEGKTKNYVISDASVSGYVNSIFNSTNSTVTVNISGSKVKDVQNNDVLFSDLKIGDIISVTETDVPDRWVGSITSTQIVFYPLETKLNLDTAVTANSTNPVTSGAVANYITPTQKGFVESEYKKALNLFNFYIAKFTSRAHGVTINNANNIIVSTGSAWETAVVQYTFPAGTHTISAVVTPSGTQKCGLRISGTNYNMTTGTHVATATLSFATDTTVSIEFYGNYSGSAYTGTVTFSNVMLNEGSTNLPYQDYGGGEIVHSEDISYSTNEVKTSSTWIDSKPIYKCTYSTTNFALTTSYAKKFDKPSGITNLVKVESIVVSGSGNAYWDNGISWGLYSDGLYAIYNDNWTATNAYITFYYTK